MCNTQIHYSWNKLLTSNLRGSPLRHSIIVTADAVGPTDTMANETQDNSTDVFDDISDEPSEVEKYIWLTGIALSTLCLILQLVLFKIRPQLRKMDQKILTQLTVARLLNSILEYLMTCGVFNLYTRDVTFALYLQTDIVLVCWMFVYTKNLYDKVVLVFALQKWNFVILSVLIWILTIPLGVLCPVFLMLGYFTEFYQAYSLLKFAILTVNVLFFCRIFYVIINRSKNSNRNFTEILKTCIISFILVCLTSLQVFVNDILSFLEVNITTNAFCVINSFQAIAATIIFLILARNCI